MHPSNKLMSTASIFLLLSLLTSVCQPITARLK